MSVNQFVLFDQTCMPAIDDLQRAIVRLGHALTLESVELRTHNGFLPASLDGVDTGFEFYLVPLAQVGDFPELAIVGSLPANRDGVDIGLEFKRVPSAETGDLPEEIDAKATHACVARTGSDMREGLAGTIFLRAFVECTQGGYWYPDDALYYPTGDAIAFLDGEIAGFRSALLRKR